VRVTAAPFKCVPEASIFLSLDRHIACFRGGLQGAESGRRLQWMNCKLVAPVSAAVAQAKLRPASVLGTGPPFRAHSTEIGPQYGSVPPK